MTTATTTNFDFRPNTSDATKAIMSADVRSTLPRLQNTDLGMSCYYIDCKDGVVILERTPRHSHVMTVTHNIAQDHFSHKLAMGYIYGR